MGEAGDEVGEPGVGGRGRGGPSTVAERGEGAVGRRADGDRSVGRLVDVERRRQRVGVALALGLGAVGQVVEDVGAEDAEQRVEHGDVDPAPDAGGAALHQRGVDGGEGVEPDR